jgi:hypothetical protein
MPFHATLPNPMVFALQDLTRKLGGQQGLLSWLDRFGGPPRQVARLYAVIGLLDQFSAEPAVVAVLRQLRSENPYPAGLADHLTPDTDDATLAGLAFEIEELLGDGQVRAAVEVAKAAVDLLLLVANRLSDGGNLADAASTARQDLDALALDS